MKRLTKTLLAVTLLLVMVFGSVIPASAETSLVTMKDPTLVSHTTTSFTVEWDSVANAAYYILLYYPEGSSEANSKQITVSAPTTKYTFSKLSKDSIYYVAVVAADYNDNLIGASKQYTVCVTKPGKLTNVKPVNWTSKSVQLTMKSNPYPNTLTGVEYQILSSSGKVVKKGVMTRWPLTVSGLSAKKLYKYKVRAQVKINGGKTWYGDWTAASWLVPQPTMKKLKLASQNRIKVSWTKVSGATKYVVYGSTSPTKGYKKIKALSGSKSSLVVSKVQGKKLQKYKNYYFKVVAYKGKVKSDDSNYAYGYIYTTFK